MSPLRRALRWSLLAFPWLLALALGVGWGLTAMAPDYLEERVPEMAAQMELPLENFNIRRAGIFSADIGPVRLGSEKEGLTVDNIAVTYAPDTLRQGRVNRVTIHGLDIDASYDGEKLTIPVMDMLTTGEPAHDDAKLPELPFDSLFIDQATLHLDYQGRRIGLPFSVTITPGERIGFEGFLTFRDQEVNFSGLQGPAVSALELSLDAKDFQLGSLGDLLPTALGGTLDMQMQIIMDANRPTDAQVETSLAVASPSAPEIGAIFAPNAVLALNATIADETLSFTTAPFELMGPAPTAVQAFGGELSAQKADLRFLVSAMNVALPGTLSASKEGDDWKTSLKVENSEQLRVVTGGRDILLGGVDLSLDGTVSSGKTDLDLRASTRSCRLDGTDVRSGAVSLRLPFNWPAPARNAPGSLVVNSIRSGDRRIGNVRTRLRQQSDDIAFDGRLLSTLLPDLVIPFDGEASTVTREAELNFSLDDYALPEGYDFGSFVPQLSDIAFSGVLDLEGGARMTRQGLETRLGVFLTDGAAKFGADGATFSGVRLFFESPDLIDFQSLPAQYLTFETVKAGRFEAFNGRFAFQVEPTGSILVESGDLDWCGGRLESRAFRIVPGSGEYDVTLFCTGLKLTEILHQFALAKASGESALDGELPITWRDGKISFNGGFLHSTPGEGGVVQIGGLDSLLATIPEGTPAHGQLHLAKHAVKDFEYDWVRLRADSVGDNLLLRLSLDGRPVQLLPFVYKKDIGGFAMLEGDVQGTRFQGLRLDLNLNLPMERLLLYRDIIDYIE